MKRCEAELIRKIALRGPLTGLRVAFSLFLLISTTHAFVFNQGAGGTLTYPGSSTAFINPFLMQPSSFGGVNCSYLMAMNPHQNYSCAELSNIYNLPLSESSLAAQMGDNYYPNQAELGEVIEADPTLQRYARDPISSVQGYIDRTTSGPTDNACPPGVRYFFNGNELYEQSGDEEEGALSEEAREWLKNQFGEQPRWEHASENPEFVGLEKNSLGSEGSEERAAGLGYTTYNDGDDNVYGTERTIWNIRAAGALLAEKKIDVSIGDISSQAGGELPPHVSHRNGKDIDMTFVGPRGSDGYARGVGCVVGQECYDKDNTVEALKAFIDVDPYGVQMILVSDTEVIEELNTYMRNTYGITTPIASHCPKHDDHAHVRYQEDENPDEIARRH